MDSTTTSPPLTPVRTYTMSPIDTSPTLSYRQHLHRRTSSFSSNHDRSPITPKSRHRFSNASQLSGEFSPHGDDGGGGGGLGNLADELDQLDAEDEFEEGVTEDIQEGDGEEQSRDSGIDVSYAHAQSENGRSREGAKHVRNFSKPFKDGAPSTGDDNDDTESEDRFSPDMEDLMSSIARMTSYTSTTEDPLIPRTIAQLQDLGNQTSLEASAQRLTTSSNSLTSHLSTQAKTLQALGQSLIPLFSSTLDPVLLEETIPLVEDLVKIIPQPNMLPVQKLQKLDRETAEVIHTLTQLTDTLQMGKQITNTATRHLRITQEMVVDLRREREKTELARHELQKTDWDEKLESRWCSGQCRDIISGFEDRCNALRGELEADSA
ncbi:hypothetical protein AC578_5464 [Pseudocercospora eumusae]|uniref:Uncharacterized protein n=1 Tax=Pseudocercospora eumusae TaxID=321146 RepID=A0A139HJY8_9PEZI|nr:hypothetical protein AC578_5464 [Pseudocercospora eumusae]